MSPRLDSPVNSNQPASDWAKSIQAALDQPAPGTPETTSAPGQTGRASLREDSTPNTLAKRQEHIDSTTGTASAVSTPGTQVPGAWTDKPVSGHQMLNDASATLASMGNAAYNALPGSLKGAFSTQTTNKSPARITMTTPAQHITEDSVGPQPGGTDDKSALPNASSVQTDNTTHEPTYTDMAKNAAAATAATVSGAATVAADTAREVYESVQDYVSPISKAESNIMPQHQTQAPQSPDEQGQLAYSRPTGAVGALPKPSSEAEVTIPSGEKGNSGPAANSGYAQENTALAEPYNPDSLHSEVEAKAVQRPRSTARDTKNKSEKADIAKEAPIKLPTSDAGTGDDCSGEVPKKPGFMQKLRVRSKIITSKLSNKPDKVAEGQDSKLGTHA